MIRLHSPLNPHILPKLTKLAERDDCTVYVMDRRTNRPLPVLRYYWGVLLKEACKRTGYHRDELHTLMKQQFGKLTELRMLDGTCHEVKGGFRSMDKQEAQQFVDRVRTFLEEQGVFVPDIDGLPEYHYVEAMDEEL